MLGLNLSLSAKDHSVWLPEWQTREERLEGTPPVHAGGRGWVRHGAPQESHHGLDTGDEKQTSGEYRMVDVVDNVCQLFFHGYRYQVAARWLESDPVPSLHLIKMIKINPALDNHPTTFRAVLELWSQEWVNIKFIVSNTFIPAHHLAGWARAHDARRPGVPMEEGSPAQPAPSHGAGLAGCAEHW